MEQRFRDSGSHARGAACAVALPTARHYTVSCALTGTQITPTANSSGLNALLTTDGSTGGGGGGSPKCSHIVGSGQTADGASWKRDISDCVTINPSKNAWREVRR